MLRRQFLFGLAAIAVTPVPALARRRFRFSSENDSPETRRFKWWIGITGGAALGLIGIVRAAFWVIGRLEENPQRPTTTYVPPYEAPKAQAAAIPAGTARATAASATFGRRTR